jgi:hypothetical protein
MNKIYALLNDENIVINVVIIESELPIETFQAIADANYASDWKSLEEYGATAIGGDFFEGKLWLPKPYPSWLRGENGWESPVPYPTVLEENEGKEFYGWDEDTSSWILF